MIAAPHVPTHAPRRLPARFASTAFAITAFASTALLTPGVATAAPEQPLRVVHVPIEALGDVRSTQAQRVDSAVRDALRFSRELKLVRAADAAEIAKRKKDAGQDKPVAAEVPQVIRKADELRQEGTDLMMEGKYKAAYSKLRRAINAYEMKWVSLVDFTKVTDAYARAGVCAFHAKKGMGAVRSLFAKGISLQPTLVIDRRKADKQLLKAFDQVSEGINKHKDGSLQVQTEVASAEVFVDGVRVGGPGAVKAGLTRGYHFVQVRAAGYKPWGKKVRVGGKKATIVKARLKAEKKAREHKPAAPPTLEDLEPCRMGGAFVKKPCRKLGERIKEAFDADGVVWTYVAADRYGRLSLLPFVTNLGEGKSAKIPEITLGQKLSGLSGKLRGLDGEIAKRLRDFPKGRALRKPPRLP